jgi:enoyl-[acyl-carrier-protein] reductase (NADH)
LKSKLFLGHHDTPLVVGLVNNEQKRDANAQQHLLKRKGIAEGIDNMAEFLHSKKANWITGQILHVDDGISSIKI